MSLVPSGAFPLFPSPYDHLAKVKGATILHPRTLCLPSGSDHVVGITSNSLGCSGVGGTGQARPTLLPASSQGWGWEWGNKNLCT